MTTEQNRPGLVKSEAVIKSLGRPGGEATDNQPDHADGVHVHIAWILGRHGIPFMLLDLTLKGLKRKTNSHHCCIGVNPLPTIVI